MIIIEGHLIPGGDSEDGMRPLTLDDCRNYHNSILSSLMDAETLIRILADEIERLTAEGVTDAEAKKALGNLLAVIQGDGGHAVNRLGWVEACRQAEALVVAQFLSRQRSEHQEPQHVLPYRKDKQ